MKHTWRVLIAASVCAVILLYGGYAFALPHDFGPKWGDSDRYGSWEKDHDWGDDNKPHKYKKRDRDDYDPKPLRFLWKHDKDEDKWGHDWGKYKDKDPDCDPMTPSPEPGTLVLLGSTLVAGTAAWRKRRSQSR